MSSPIEMLASLNIEALDNVTEQVEKAIHRFDLCSAICEAPVDIPDNTTNRSSYLDGYWKGIRAALAAHDRLTEEN